MLTTSIPAPPVTRWPLQPLLDASRLSVRHLADHARVPVHTMRRAAKNGLTTDTAELWAISVRLHPFEVWGWDWLDATAAGGEHVEGAS